MSTKSSFRERLERQDDTEVEPRSPSSSPANVLIQMREGLSAPVSFALLLRDNGLSLPEAHAAATKLAAKGSLLLTLHPSNLRDLLDQLEQFGLRAYAVRDTRTMRVLVPAALVPPDLHASRDKNMSALQTNLSKKTVGDLRRIYGKSFAKNYKSSARLSDVLYSMDPAALETIATSRGGPTATRRKDKVETS